VISSVSLLPTKAADTLIVGSCWCRALWFYKLQDQKSRTFHWHRLLGDSHNVVANIFALQGSQYFDCGLMLLHSPWIIQDAAPKIVDAPLTLTFRMRQQACRIPFCQSGWPLCSVWEDVTTQPFDSRLCKTTDHSRSIYAHIKHIVTVIVHLTIVCHISYRHYWQPI